MSNNKRGRPTNEARKQQGLILIPAPNSITNQVISESQKKDRERKNNNTFKCRTNKNFKDRQIFENIKMLVEKLESIIPSTSKINSSFHDVKKSSRNISNLSINEKAEDFRKRKTEEWNQLLDYGSWMEGVLHNYDTSSFENEVITKFQCAKEHFDKYTCCEHCQFVFRKDGLTQHINACKIKIRMELKSLNGSNESEKSNEIYKAHKKVFNNIKEQNLTIQCLLEYLNHENEDFKAYDSLVKDFKTRSVSPFNDDVKRKRVSSENEPEKSSTIDQNDILFYNEQPSIGISANRTSDEFKFTSQTYFIPDNDFQSLKVSIQPTETNSSNRQSDRCFYDVDDFNLETIDSIIEEQSSNIEKNTETGNIQNFLEYDILNNAYELTVKDIGEDAFSKLLSYIASSEI